jgi:hypothetical protein
MSQSAAQVLLAAWCAGHQIDPFAVARVLAGVSKNVRSCSRTRVRPPFGLMRRRRRCGWSWWGSSRRAHSWVTWRS